jgi:cell shape-determining protein MreD
VREQIKWIAFAASVVALGVSGAVVLGTFAPDAAGGTHPLLIGLLEDAITLSFAGVPIAVGFAVLKYRLYNIDVIINRTLVYSALTAALVAVYFGGVAATEAVVRTLTGQEQQPQLAIVVSTLVIAALFNPLRRRIQSFMDRRFYRRKYDAAKTLEAFSAKLRDETDLDALSDDLVGVVRETMQPAHVSLWLRPDPGSKGGE